MVGYVQRKVKAKYPNFDLSEGSSKGWLELLSKGNLVCPNDRLVTLCQFLKAEFEKFHGKDISRSDNPMESLLDNVTAKLNSPINKETTYIIKLFLKIRFFNRLKWLNEQQQLKESTEKIRRLKQRAQHMY